MSPTLASLIALQRLDTAAEAARRRVADMPAAEAALRQRIADASAAVDAAKARLADNQKTRRDLEKQVAVVDGRLARFDDHKAAVKTNQEFTALLHEIATAKGEKDALEDQILMLLETADTLTAELKAAETALAEARRGADAEIADLTAERRALDAEMARLTGERAQEASAIEPPVLARYEQLLRMRRMVAVAPIDGERCTACHVRLRPAVAQHVRRNEDVVTCDSCQRILYFEPRERA
jgi:predicted  nucleic acid-binding Zn-ribbon protein